MFEFNHYFPTRIIFGRGKIDELNSFVKQYGKRVFLVCGEKSSQKSGIIDLIKNMLKNDNISCFVYEGVSTNPTEDIISNGVNEFKKSDFDLIISVGGGSVHDSAKAIALSLNHEGSLYDYTVTGKFSVPGIKKGMKSLLTIPTISGTGAEISPASLVKLNNQKHIIFSPFLFPAASIIDVDLLSCDNPKVLSQVGIDAFYQSVEAFLASNSNPFSDKFAASAIVNIMKYLPLLVDEPDNIEAKSYVALSSIDALIGVANSGVGAIHALSDPLSGMFNIHHGLALSIVAKQVFYSYIKLKVSKINTLEEYIYKYLKPFHNSLSNKFMDQFDWFISQLNIDINQAISDIKDYDYKIDSLVHDSDNPDMSTSPVKFSKSDIQTIFLNSLR